VPHLPDASLDAPPRDAPPGDAAEGEAGAPPWGARLRGWALGAVAWLALAVPFGVQNVLALREYGRPMAWGPTLGRTLAAFVVSLPALPLLGWGVRRFGIRPGRLAPRGLALGAVVLAAVALRQLVVTPLLGPHLWLAGHEGPTVAGAISDALVFLAVVAVLHARQSYREARARELDAARLAQRLAETQLAALRAQLQPHFLFNTLNAVTALMRDEPDVADRMLTRLAELLRVVLEPPAGDEHTLGEELAVLERYLEIMSLRFGPRLTVETSVPAALHSARVPWLVLQPLVENALEHGAGGRRGGVHVRVRAAAADASLVVEVCDDGPGPGGGSRGTGIGLANTRRRLARLHGSAASLTLEARPQGGACARLVLPRHAAPPAPRAGGAELAAAR
jgi:signal transduction histidine kinase